MKKYYSILLLFVFLISCSKNQDETSPQNDPYAEQIEALLSKMTLEEKIGQTNLRGTSSRSRELSEELKESVRKGHVGALLNVMNTEFVDELQQIAIEESPNKIPLLFGRDVVHGFKTVFPIPLGLAASWDTEAVKKGSRIAAMEASSVGIRWTFAPMLDISRDSRWGRIAESPGEDPYLASLLGKAYVEGFQSDSLNDPTSLAACAKHYIGYGAAEGGRDYNTTIISDPLLRNVYLPAFQTAIDAGAATVMTSFNEINGVPATGNSFLLKDVLRGELNFNGFVVSDWDSSVEMIAHGYAKDEKHVAELTANAGLDMEMNSKAYEHHLKTLIEEGSLSEAQIDDFVRNILRIKFQLGLFDNPHRDKNREADFYHKEHLEAAKQAAIQSTVLLKNETLLPLKSSTKVALIGPLADAPHDQLGTWAFDGDQNHTVTVLDAFKNSNSNFRYAQGLTYSRDQSKKQFRKAITTAKSADVIVFVAGEEAILSGEAHSRSQTHLPGAQEALIKELAKTGKPIVLILMAGRPITLTNILPNIHAVLMTWHPGTMGGEAIHEILFGKEEPQGRLPITWPINAGQSPIYYNHKNTGRPANDQDYVAMNDIPIGAWQSSLGNDSHYLDIGFRPQWPFGYGFGYTQFEYKNLQISKDTLGFDEQLIIKASITNTGARAGKETVPFYVQDVVGSITRPVRELKGFEQVSLKSGESKEVTFVLSSEDLKFTNHQGVYAAEEGDFNLWIGSHSATGLKKSVYLKK
jgi:beta-glucosidase